MGKDPSDFDQVHQPGALPRPRHRRKGNVLGERPPQADFFDTLDGELMLTILVFYVQEESKIVSDNCKGSRDFSEGKPVNLTPLYG